MSYNILKYIDKNSRCEISFWFESERFLNPVRMGASLFSVRKKRQPKKYPSLAQSHGNHKPEIQERQT